MDETLKEKLSNFIDIPEKIKDLKGISNMDLIHVKGIDLRKASILRNVLHVSKIEDLARKDINEEEFLMLKLLGIEEFDLNIWSFFSRMIVEGKIDKYIGPSKTLIVGLDNAGKTAILNVLQNKFDLKTFHNLSPTIGINREIIHKYGMEHVVLDLGGQELYRKQYLQKADVFFNVEFLMYVIDVQDSARFEEALNYLQDVIKAVEYMKENPEFLIIIHKVDPDIQNEMKIQDAIQGLTNKIHGIFKDKNVNYDITTFSIFNLIGDNKTIVSEIRNFITSGALPDEVTHEHKEDLILKSSLERILNIVINLSSTVEQRLSKIESGMEDFRRCIEYFRTNYEITSKPTLKMEQPPVAKSIKKVYPINQAIRDELKSILKMRKLND